MMLAGILSRYSALTSGSCLVLLLYFLSSDLALAQVPDSSAAKPQNEVMESSSGTGNVIELEDVQIKGEIAQPNVSITIARQVPQLRKIALEPTMLEGIDDIEILSEFFEWPEATRVENWNEILNRPRE